MPEICRFYGIIEMTDGDLPNKAQEMVKEWLTTKKNELLNMWETQKIIKLTPLQ